MGVLVEELAARAVREHLLAKLPAKVSEVNALRAPSLKAPLAGTYAVTAGMSLKVAVDGGAESTVALTTGAARTAAQVASDFAVAGVSASASGDHLAVATSAAPSSATKAITIGADSTGANVLFGWPDNGDSVTRAPLVAPSSKGVADGWPLLNDMGAGFWVIIGDRESVPVSPHPRKDEYLVALELAVFSPVTNEQAHRDRESIHACIRCVRECLLTDAGLQVGRASAGDVMLVTEKMARIPGRPWKMKGADAPNALFDVAAMQLNVRVFERPAAS